nr:MAG TPA: carbohydrate-binding protein [Bacteriophage sp.]
MLAAEGNILIETQRNDDTSTITLNQRFVFGGVPNKVKGQVYEVYAFKTHMDDETTNEKLLGLELRRLNVNEGQDDLYNNISDIYKKNWYKIEVNEDDMTQAVGFDKKLNYSVFKDNDIVAVDVIWESSNEKVAQVDNEGNLKVVGIGQSVITCYMKDNHEVKGSFIVTGIFKEELPKAEEYVINPLLIDVILQGDEQVITFNHCIDEVPDGETFNVKLSGVPYNGSYAGYYFDFDTDTGNLTQCNSIKLTNNREFTKGRLKIEISSNVSGELIQTLNIRLGGIM